MNMLSISLFLFFLVLIAIDAQNTCSDRHATCISIRKCASVIKILRGPLSSKMRETIINLKCGDDDNGPLICCVPEIDPPVTVRNDIPNPPDVTNHRNLHLLNHQSCGPVPQQKLFGGNKTAVLEYTWMALIMYDSEKPDYRFRCGGTIISDKYILTAAHCVTGLLPGVTLSGVRVGDHDINTERDCDKDKDGIPIVCADKYQNFGIERVDFHPDFKNNMQDDIALIKLNGTIDFTLNSVSTVCLPLGNAAMFNKTMAKMVVTGWGLTEYWVASRSLLEANLPVVSYEQCKEIYKGIAEVSYKQICAGGENMIGSCVGDSGGPLQMPVVFNGRPRTVQYGVVSFGLKQCGTEGYPAVFTRVSHYMKWILDTMRD